MLKIEKFAENLNYSAIYIISLVYTFERDL